MPVKRTDSGLLLVIDRDSGQPVHRQVETTIRDSIRSGRLALGAPLPPTRQLAADLGVSRGVVVEAYEQLRAEGYLSARTGGRTVVSAGTVRNEVAPPAPPARPVRVDFSYGRADLSNFPRAAWLRSIRTALAAAPNDVFGYLPGSGVPQLRSAIAEYLDRVRATCARPEHVVITTGYAQGSALLIQVLAATGMRRLAVEDPSPADDAMPAARAAGIDVIGIPVEPDGIDVSALEDSGAEAVIVTPSHQWPTGAVLSSDKRSSLLRWAAERDAVIIEDDYDAEFRYERSPLGALQGLDPEHVVYAGTASKSLAPGLRLGWFVTPPALSTKLAHAKDLADRGSSALDQLTLADFVRRGEFDRHLRRMRPIYRRRRDYLLAQLSRRLPELEPTGIAAGMHLVAWLPDDWDEDEIVAAAERRGLVIHGIRPYWLGSPGRPGLIFGFATLTEERIAEGVALLADAVRGK